MQKQIITNNDLLDIEREYCKRSLVNFVRRAWRVLEPGSAYVHGWHIDAICEHLEAVTSGQINRLLVNVPPGAMKSLLTSVLWPAWEWGPMALESMRYISASHEMNLSTRDSLKMRRLVESEWYQKLWTVKLMGDQNTKTYYDNDKTGFRQAAAMRSLTGKRGDRLLLDDPHSVESALSAAERETDLRVFRETVPTRLNNPEKSAIIVIMQRLHEGDISGYLIDEGLGYEKLILPMEYEKSRHCVTSIGFEDPRTEENELLFPERFSIKVVERDKKVMGSMAVAGQFQQRPAPRSGGFFKWESLQIVEATPQINKTVRYWDKAGSDGAGAFTAGVKVGLATDGLYYVLDVVRGQWSAPKREQVIKQTAELDGKLTEIWIEQEPGSGGKESAESTIRNLSGYTIRAERATGEKAIRAEPYAVQVEAGNIKVLRASWNALFIDEHKTFPVGKYKDQIDAAGGAFNKLAVVKRKPIFGTYSS